MRPQEILGMVEEGAGTRMFEDRKDKAKKTMGKKEKRVQEITSLLEEEITPKLEKLRAEKRSYIQYQKTTTELERIARVLQAYDWTEASNKVETKQQEIEEKQGAIKKLEGNKKKALKESEAAEKSVEDVVKRRDEEMSKGGKLKKLQDHVDGLGKELVKVKTQAELKEATIEDEEGKIKTMEGELEEVSILFILLLYNC